MRSAALALSLVFLVFSVPAFAGGDAKKGPPVDDRAAKRISSSIAYVHGPTLVTQLNSRFGAQRASITVEIGWDVPDAALRARMWPLRSRLTDATRAALSDYAINRQRPGASPNLEQLGALLQQATDATLGGPGARLLLANVVILQR